MEKIEKIIESWKELLALYNQITNDNNKYIFRGQSNVSNKEYNEWSLNSSMERQNRYKNLNSYEIIEITKKQIEYIQNKLIDNSQNELELVSEMQHEGTPTALIDFTSNFWISIWFAASEEIDEEKDKNKCFFDIYIMDIQDKEIKYKIENLNKDIKEKNIYSCPKNIKRGLSQKSYFIFKNYDDILIKYNIKKYRIPYSLQEEILEKLESMLINPENIFPDKKGLYLSFEKYSPILIQINIEKHLINKQYVKAENECKKLNKIYPKSDLAYVNWGVALANQGYLNEAIEKCKKAIEINSKSDLAYVNWGAALAKQGYLNEAIEKCKKAIEINHKSDLAYVNWGVALTNQENFNEAIEKFKKAIEINPKSDLAYVNWGFVLANQGYFNEVIKKSKKAIEINTKSDAAYVNWGVALANQGYLNEAIKKFKKAIEINPRSDLAYVNWGVALANQGYLNEAIEKIDKAIEINPNNKKYKEDLINKKKNKKK